MIKEREIADGEGTVLDEKGRRVAVCKVDGVVHTLSPICSHAGCEVEWNGGEKTWDCPCHGSVYAADGSVVNGPAEEPLTKLSDMDDEK